MKELKKADYIIILCILLIIGGIVLAVFLPKDEGTAKSNTDKTISSNKVSDIKAFDGRIMGIWVGTSFEKPTLEIFPNSEYLYFDNDTDMILALDTGKIDGFIIDEPIARMASKENSNLSYFK